MHIRRVSATFGSLNPTAPAPSISLAPRASLADQIPGLAQYAALTIPRQQLSRWVDATTRALMRVADNSQHKKPLIAVASLRWPR